MKQRPTMLVQSEDKRTLSGYRNRWSRASTDVLTVAHEYAQNPRVTMITIIDENYRPLWVWYSIERGLTYDVIG